MENFLDQLQWRRAEKNFDPEHKLSDQQVGKVLQAVHMSPSSFGVQPYHIHVVSDQETKSQLKAKGFNQDQFTDCSHTLVFAARTDLIDRVDQFAKISGAKDEYINMIKGFIEKMDSDAQKAWAERQTYIALGFALAACAELGIDSCPMEGFDPAGFDQVLNIKSPMHSVVVMTLGKRKKESGRDKVRFSNEDLFTKV